MEKTIAPFSPLVTTRPPGFFVGIWALLDIRIWCAVKVRPISISQAGGIMTYSAIRVKGYFQEFLHFSLEIWGKF